MSKQVNIEYQSEPNYLNFQFYENSLLETLEININNIKSIKPNWKRTHYRAVINWLTKYKPLSDSPNPEKIKGYLEAFYHLCEVEAWEKGGKILLTRLNTPSNELLHDQLDTWGYYLQQSDLYRKLIGKSGIGLDAICLTGLGKAYHAQHKYYEAIDYLFQSLIIRLLIKDIQGFGTNLGYLGLVFDSLGHSNLALEYHHKHLTIARQLQDREGERMALGNLGNAYISLGDCVKAEEYHQQHLALGQELKHLKSEGNALGSLGIM
ncbi:tetratricopeptide repeat protein [Nostoc sp.]